MIYVIMHPNHLPINNINYSENEIEVMPDLQLCHECFQCLQEFPCSLVGYLLLV